ncbi:MAG: glycosyltransferase family 2 protein [Candidatus Brocadiia bacterium]
MAVVSAIILSHNKSKYTRATLASLVSTRGVKLEVILIDNGSTDGTRAMLEEMKDEFAEQGHVMRCHFNETNVGCCTGRNQGLEMARGEYCAFLDNDVMAVENNWASELISTLEEEENAGIVGPKMIYPFGPHQIQCAGVGVSPNGRIKFRGRGDDRHTPRYNVRREVQCLISACFLFPRSLYEEIGGLDEVFNPIEFEDFDFCYRAKEAGYCCIYEPGVEMYHWESITSEGTAKLPNTYLIIKHGIIFKKRWRHMFKKEDGPPDSECKWEKITMESLDGKRSR